MFKNRILDLRKRLEEKNLDAILVSKNSNIFYLSGANIFQPNEHEGLLFISKNKSFIITSSLYSEVVKKNTNGFELLEINNKNSLSDNLKVALQKSDAKKVGFEEDSLTVSEYLKFKKILILKPAAGIIEDLRQVKDNDEIKKIKKACEITDKAFDYILTEIKTGVTEIEIANKLKGIFEKMNTTFSFEPIVAFGKNSSMPHHISTTTKLSKNQIVLMDFGVKFEGYCSDFTRTVFFGKAPDKFKRIYQSVLNSQTKAFEYLDTKDPKLEMADQISREFIKNQGFPDIPHSLGHGVGIDVHDGLRLSPKSEDKLQENMVFSLEPGIYLPEFGGVRIEDLVLYQKNKPEFITLSNRELIEL